MRLLPLVNAFVLALAFPLAACDGADQGTSISVTGNGADGNRQVAGVDGTTGQVKIDVPGFQGTFKLPKIQMTADNFDLNGVRLYPGSKVSGFNVATKGEDDGQVRIAFDSPATAATVRAWFAERLPKAGFRVRADGQGLIGTTDDKKPFALKLDQSGADRARGTITIG